MKMVSGKVALALGGVDGDARIVADVLVRAGDIVEKRRLAAVGVTDKGDVDGVGADLGVGVVVLNIRRLGDCSVPRRHVHIGTRFALQNRLYLDKVGLGAPQAHLIVHYMVLDRVAQRSLEVYPDLATAHKAHLHNAFAKATVAVHLHNHATLTCM